MTLWFRQNGKPEVDWQCEITGLHEKMNRVHDDVRTIRGKQNQVDVVAHLESIFKRLCNLEQKMAELREQQLDNARIEKAWRQEMVAELHAIYGQAVGMEEKLDCILEDTALMSINNQIRKKPATKKKRRITK